MEIKRLREDDLFIAEDILRNFLESSSKNDVLLSTNHLTDLLKNETCYLIAALENSSTLGFVLAYRFPSFHASENTAYLYDIKVLLSHRRKGIGRQLIEQLIKQLKSDGVNEIWLGTGVENIPAQGLLSSTGAQKEEETFYEYLYYLKLDVDVCK